VLGWLFDAIAPHCSRIDHVLLRHFIYMVGRIAAEALIAHRLLGFLFFGHLLWRVGEVLVDKIPTFPCLQRQILVS
jgi:hypothetical protein